MTSSLKLHNDRKAMILQLLHGLPDGLTAREIREAMDMTPKAAEQFLTKLRKFGVLRLHGRGTGARWFLPDLELTPEDRKAKHDENRRKVDQARKEQKLTEWADHRPKVTRRNAADCAPIVGAGPNSVWQLCALP
jgi:DNA-binding transcriptional MerR regulator